jgi:hypothetical protein
MQELLSPLHLLFLLIAPPLVVLISWIVSRSSRPQRLPMEGPSAETLGDIVANISQLRVEVGKLRASVDKLAESLSTRNVTEKRAE